MTYKLWDKKSKINGFDAGYFLNGVLKGYDGDVILFENGGKVTNVEMKGVLAQIFDIDASLPLDEFVAEYKEKLDQED